MRQPLSPALSLWPPGPQHSGHARGDESVELTSQYTASSKQFSSAGCPQIGNFKMHPKGRWRSQEVRTYFLPEHPACPRCWGSLSSPAATGQRQRVSGSSQLALLQTLGPPTTKPHISPTFSGSAIPTYPRWPRPPGPWPGTRRCLQPGNRPECLPTS